MMGKATTAPLLLCNESPNQMEWSENGEEEVNNNEMVASEFENNWDNQLADVIIVGGGDRETSTLFLVCL